MCVGAPEVAWSEGSSCPVSLWPRAARRVSPLSKVSKTEQLRRGQAAGGPSLVRPGPELQQFTCAVGPGPFQARGPCQLRRAPC